MKKSNIMSFFVAAVAVLTLLCHGFVFAAHGDPRSTLMTDPDLLKGVDAYMRGDYDACYKLFNEVFEKNTNLAPPGVLMAQLFSSDGKYVMMRKYLEMAANEHPNDPETFFQLAGIAIQENRTIEAQLLLDKGLSVLNSFTKTRGKTDGKPDERVDYLVRESRSLLANLARTKGDFEKAAEQIQLLVERFPKDTDAWTSLGFLLFKQDKISESRKAFARAKELDPSLPADWLLLAQLYQHEGKDEQSRKLVEKHFDPTKTSLSDLVLIVRLYTKWGRFDDALKLVEQMLQSDPNSGPAWTLLGELALYRSEFSVAENRFRKALLIDSTNFEATNGMALALADQSNRQKLGEAFTIAQKNWRHNPGLPEAITTYAWTLYLLGQRDEAERLFAPMLEKGEITPTVAYYLAEMENSKGATALALNFLELALEHDSWFPKRSAAMELRDLVLKNEK